MRTLSKQYNLGFDAAGGGSAPPPATPNLQEVTTAGNTTTENIATAGLQEPTRTVTGTYTATVNDFTIFLNNTAGNVTLNLPTGSAFLHSIFVIKCTGYSSANTIFVDNNIDGVTGFSFTAVQQSIVVQNTSGVNYQVVASNGISTATTPNLQTVTTAGNTTTENIKTAGLAEPVRTVTGTYAATINDFTILLDNTGGNAELTLPTGSAFIDCIYAIRMANFSGVHVNYIYNEIDNVSGYSFTAVNQSIIVQNVDGTNYNVIASNGVSTASTPNLQTVTTAGNTTTENIATAGIAEAINLQVGPVTYFPTVNDFLILGDTTSGAVQVTLNGSLTGSIYVIKNLKGTNILTVNVSGVGTIDGNNTLILYYANESVTLMCGPSGNQYQVLDHYIPNLLSNEIDLQDTSTSISNGTYVLNLSVKVPFSIIQVSIQSGNGTATAAVQINGTNVPGLGAISISGALTNASWTGATGTNFAALNNKVTLVITGAASLANLQFSMLTYYGQ